MSNEYAIEIIQLEINKWQEQLKLSEAVKDEHGIKACQEPIAELQSAIKQLSSTDKVIGTYFIPNMATSSGDMTIEGPTEYWGIPFELILREVKQ